MNRTRRMNDRAKPLGLGKPLIQNVAATDRVPTHPAVARSIAFMAQNFDRIIQLKEMVAISGMSRRGFIKAFNKQVGKTPAATLRLMRIEHAKRLLLTQDLSLNELARCVGFRSANTFCVAFQRAIGVAPKKFQRQVWLAERRGQSKFENLSLLPPIIENQDQRSAQFTVSNHL